MQTWPEKHENIIPNCSLYCVLKLTAHGCRTHGPEWLVVEIPACKGADT